VAHRCPACGGWLATYVHQIGSWQCVELRVIECRPTCDNRASLRRILLNETDQRDGAFG
jgi:hypothetical protein